MPTRGIQTARSGRHGPSPEKAEVLEPQNQPNSGPIQDVSENRRKPRFKLAIDIRIHSKSCGLLKGRTIDISEIGIAAVLGEDVPVGEVVKLHFTLPSGPVTIRATVRQRSSFFRYGFEFIESSSVRENLQSACRQLAVQQSASGRP
jgi:PilZ domain-containing protein